LHFRLRAKKGRAHTFGVAIAAATAACAVLLGASAAGAQPSIPEKQRQAALILEQVQQLDADVAAAAKRFNGAGYELGRLVFFRALRHMGMYVGGGNVVHGQRAVDVVEVSNLSEPYGVADWVGARRVL
jgi:cell wall-associated NlpC family hydrolase